MTSRKPARDLVAGDRFLLNDRAYTVTTVRHWQRLDGQPVLHLDVLLSRNIPAGTLPLAPDHEVTVLAE